MTAFNIMLNNPTTLLASTGAAVTAMVAIVPLLAGCWLLSRAGQRRGLRDASANDLGSLVQELHDNYERLRRSPEAIPLTAVCWQRLNARLTNLPPAVETALRQTYRTIEVSNHVLSAVSAYDRRGGLSVKQRRMALWPTLEAAVRSSLHALGVQPTPARQVGPRLVEGIRSAAEGLRQQPLKSAFTLDKAPRLALFYAPTEEAAASAEAKSAERAADNQASDDIAAAGAGLAQSAGRAPAAKGTRRAAARLRAAVDREQIPLWESVA